MAFADYFIQELKSRNSIEDVVSSYVNLKKNGKDYIGLCPFHNEKTPSFRVTPSKGFCHCFGCGEGGDVISFISKIENLNFTESVKFLANRVGMALPEDTYVDKSMQRLKIRIKEINRETARFYHEYLTSEGGKKGLDYFLGRGLSMQTIKHFGLGYSPESKFALVDHLKELKYTEHEMLEANVAYKTKSGKVIDRFYGRVMFPIIDKSGIVTAFGGRALGDEKPKYINTSDTQVYKKSDGLFAMNFAKNTKTDQLILAEGYMDVISLHAAGFTNAIASLGTALTSGQVKIIKDTCHEVVICYDSDSAGQKATKRAIPMLRDAGLKVRVLTVPGNKDPDEFFKSNGKNGPLLFRKLLDECVSDTEYLLNLVKAKYDVTTTDGINGFVNEACTILADIDNDIERNIYAGKIGEEASIDKSAILSEINKILRSKEKQRGRQEQIKITRDLSGLNDKVNLEKREDNKRKVAYAEEAVIHYLFNNPEKRNHLEETIPPREFSTEFNRKLYDMLLEQFVTCTDSNLVNLTGLSQDEASAFSQLIYNPRMRFGYSETDIDTYCVSTIINGEKTAKAKESIKNDNLSDRDFENTIYSLRKNRNRTVNFIN